MRQLLIRVRSSILGVLALACAEAGTPTSADTTQTVPLPDLPARQVRVLVSTPGLPTAVRPQVTLDLLEGMELRRFFLAPTESIATVPRGHYRVYGALVDTESAQYVRADTAVRVELGRGFRLRGDVTLPYKRITGSLRFRIEDRPPEASALPVAWWPNGAPGFPSSYVLDSVVLPKVPAGQYWIALGPYARTYWTGKTFIAERYVPVPALQLVEVLPTETPTVVTVRYQLESSGR